MTRYILEVLAFVLVALLMLAQVYAFGAAVQP
jgi:hypothetical protein